MATVWTAVAVAVLVSVAMLGYWLGAAAIVRHRAEAAADLGALAAASHAAEGPGRACDRARWVAEHMDTAVVGCRWERLDALVEVATPDGVLGQTTAHARAGPSP